MNILKNSWVKLAISLILVPVYVIAFEYLRSLGDNDYSFKWYTCIINSIFYIIAWNLIAIKIKKKK